MPEILGKSWDIQRRLEERAKRLGRGRFGRVLKMARKPTSDEYSRVVMITGLGLLFIGFMGFFIYWFMKSGYLYIENLFR